MCRVLEIFLKIIRVLRMKKLILDMLTVLLNKILKTMRELSISSISLEGNLTGESVPLNYLKFRKLTTMLKN
jgi:hypothetical protein